MKKIFKGIIALIMSVLMIASAGSAVIPVAVGNVKTLSVQSSSASGIALKWTKTSGADGYRIFRYVLSEKKWKALKTTRSLKYTDTAVNSGEVYYYRVKAYEKVNGKTVFSKNYSNTVKIVLAPDKVTGLSATKVTGTDITLKWNKSRGATGYVVYLYDNSAKKYVKLGTTANSTITVAQLQSGESYTFAIRAYKKSGATRYSPYSSKLTVKTKIADVNGFRLSGCTASSYTLSWQAAAGVTGYQLAAYNESTKEWKTAAFTTKTTYTVSGSQAMTPTKYRVRTYLSKNGSYTYGNYSATVVGACVPGVPTNLQGAVNSDNGISLKWTAVAGASGYDIHSYNAANGTWSVIGSSTKNSYTVKKLTQTDTYKYAVSSYILVSGQKVSSEKCESVSVFFKTENKSNNIYTGRMEKKGVFGYLYDPAENCFYTSADPWQRVVGYNSIFDIAAPMSLIGFDTVRLRFEYENKDWMIQLWKGQYGLVFYGAEVGVYTKPKDRQMMHYDAASDSDMLKMSMTFHEKKTALGQSRWVKVFSRPYGSYWWCTGFVPGNRYGQYSNMKLEMRITMKDYDMLSGVTQALKSNGISYTVKGLDVYFTYF